MPDGTHDIRGWTAAMVAGLRRDAGTAADTPLLRLELPAFPGIPFLFKDETTHPSGSLKHRLAHSLFLYALCNGRLRPGQPVVDASSGSTAISEAWFARRLGIRFTAVMPACTAPAKVAMVQALGGACELVEDPGSVHARAARLAEAGACHLDQFGLAERATDWRGNNNIAESLVAQLEEERASAAWIVCGAGTGGTSATIGRYLRYTGLGTRLCVAEPSGSAFATGWRSGDRTALATTPTLVEGVGRPRVEPGFVFEVVDAVLEVDDADSIAAAWRLESLLGRRYGGSSGTNFAACLRLARDMRARGERGAIVAILGDPGDRYDATLFDPAWLAARGVAVAPALARLEACLAGGTA